MGGSLSLRLGWVGKNIFSSSFWVGVTRKKQYLFSFSFILVEVVEIKIGERCYLILICCSYINLSNLLFLLTPLLGEHLKNNIYLNIFLFLGLNYI